MGNDVMARSELTAVNMNNTVVRASVWRAVTGESWERRADAKKAKAVNNRSLSLHNDDTT